jgi:hypothetical protein
MSLWLVHICAALLAAIAVGAAGLYMKVEPSYLAVAMAGLIVAQAIDIDHKADYNDKVKCALSLDEEADCDKPMLRGVFHDKQLFFMMLYLSYGLFTGWVIHLKMDGVL